jgi:flagellar biogenesis protein FliO
MHRSPRWLAERIGAVVAVFFALVLAQRWLPRKRQSLLHGRVQVCGKVPLDSNQSLHLVRLGQRLLVLLESPQGMQCVAEITDPSEVRRLLEAEAPDSGNRPVVNVRHVLSTFRQRASSPA